MPGLERSDEITSSSLFFEAGQPREMAERGEYGKFVCLKKQNNPRLVNVITYFAESR